MNEANSTAVGKLHELLPRMKQSPIWTQIVEPRDRVLARFQPLLTPPHIPHLTAAVFPPIPYFESNGTRPGLHPQSSRLGDDLPKQQKPPAILLDEARPLQSRLDNIVGTLKGFGKATITAILHVAHPEFYGVWNTTSEGGLLS